MKQPELEALAVSSRRAAILSSLGAVIVLGSLAYSAIRLARVETAVAQKQEQVVAIDTELKKREAVIRTLTRDVENLRNTQNGLLEFLANVTDESQVSILDRDVNWGALKADIDRLPSGKRKQALLTAILLAWKDIPFRMGEQSVSRGFDSPRFIEYVLAKSGVKIRREPGERLSDTLMRTFKKMEKPRPGDVVMYKGQVGSFGFIYLSDGMFSSAGVGIGTLQAAAPLQIINLSKVKTPHYPLIGYFRVVYPDETEQAQPSAPEEAPRAARP